MRPVDLLQKQEGGRRAASRGAARAIAPAWSIRLARQVEVGEGAVNVRRHDLARRADVGFVEFAVGGDAEQRQADADLVLEDLEEAHHALGASRGTDVVKALISGADAVACGRLYVYGLAAAGAEGMVRLFEILEDEIRICLSLLGVAGYHELDKSYIRPARQVVPPHVHSAFPHLNLARETY